MVHDGTEDLTEQPAADLPRPFASLLTAEPAESGEPAGQTEPAEPADDEIITDLRLDQVIEAVAGRQEERQLVAGLLSRQVGDIDTLTYRHEVFRDLEDAVLFEAATTFAGHMSQVRAHIDQLAKMKSAQQREGWFLDAAVIYCDAAGPRCHPGLPAPRLARSAGIPRLPRGLPRLRRSSPGSLSDTADRKNDLARIMYQVRVKGLRVEVSRYDGEPDYSAEIEKTFERFQQGAVKDYRVAYRGWPGMNHVGAYDP